MTQFLYLGAGTLAGGFARYFLTGAVTRLTGAGFPYGTLTVNLLGCFIIGFLGVLANERLSLGPEAQLLWMTGFCGAFTTFSTFMLETGTLTQDGHPLRAFAYILLSVSAGFAAYRLGIGLAHVGQ